MNLTVNQIQVLSALLDGEKYGLGIIESIKSRGGKINLGSLYNVLNSLEKKGMIVGEYKNESLEDRRGHRRRYYNITGKGKEVYHEAELNLLASFNLSL